LLALVQANVDESGGKGQGAVFVFSALISAVEHWNIFMPAWQACLDEAPKMAYFKMWEAAQRKCRFSIPQRDEKLKKLCRIIATNQLVEQHTVQIG